MKEEDIRTYDNPDEETTYMFLPTKQIQGEIIVPTYADLQKMIYYTTREAMSNIIQHFELVPRKVYINEKGERVIRTKKTKKST